MPFATTDRQRGRPGALVRRRTIQDRATCDFCDASNTSIYGTPVRLPPRCAPLASLLRCIESRRSLRERTHSSDDGDTSVRTTAPRDRGATARSRCKPRSRSGRDTTPESVGEPTAHRPRYWPATSLARVTTRPRKSGWNHVSAPLVPRDERRVCLCDGSEPSHLRCSAVVRGGSAQW